MKTGIHSKTHSRPEMKIEDEMRSALHPARRSRVPGWDHVRVGGIRHAEMHKL